MACTAFLAVHKLTYLCYLNIAGLKRASIAVSVTSVWHSLIIIVNGSTTVSAKLITGQCNQLHVSQKGKQRNKEIVHLRMFIFFVPGCQDTCMQTVNQPLQIDTKTYCLLWYLFIALAMNINKMLGSGSMLDSRSIGQASILHLGHDSYQKFISLAQVVSSPVQLYRVELWPKTALISFHFIPKMHLINPSILCPSITLRCKIMSLNTIHSFVNLLSIIR